MGPRKLRRVADAIRGKSVREALVLLQVRRRVRRRADREAAQERRRQRRQQPRHERPTSCTSRGSPSTAARAAGSPSASIRARKAARTSSASVMSHVTVVRRANSRRPSQPRQARRRFGRTSTARRAARRPARPKRDAQEERRANARPPKRPQPPRELRSKWVKRFTRSGFASASRALGTAAGSRKRTTGDGCTKTSRSASISAA